MKTKKEIQDQIQYWYSKYCNSIMIDEKEIYYSLYQSYQNLKKYYIDNNYI